MELGSGLNQKEIDEEPNRDLAAMQKKIRLCHVQCYPLLAGSQRSMLNIFQYLDRNKYDISVICKEEGELTKVLLDLGINFFTVPALDNQINPFQDLRALFQIMRIMKREKFDIVHTTTAKAGFVGRIGAKLAGVPIIIHLVQGFEFHEFSSRLAVAFLSFLEKMAGLISTRIIFVNNEERKWAVERGVVPPNKGITIYNGVNLDEFNILNNNVFHRNKAREQLGISGNSDSHVVGFVGRLWEQKDPQVVTDVARILVKDYDLKNIIFLIVGDGYLREEMEESVNEYEITENVRFLGWRHDVNQIYPAMDVLFLPSLWEGLPLTILEAMAFGIPVVASDIKGNREAVLQQETGFLIPPKCVNLFAAAIMQILNDKELAEAMGKKARKRVEIFYNGEITAKEVINSYETCLRDKGIHQL